MGSRRVAPLVLAAALGACAPDGAAGADQVVDAPPDETADAAEQLHPDVVDASATRASDGTWTFTATISSPYDTPQRYADAWRVLAPDGGVLGVRELLHDHAGEQPFTRELRGVQVPDGTARVTIQGRDLRHGWGGATAVVELD